MIKFRFIRIDKKIFVSFVLLVFCLLFNVSYCAINTDKTYTYSGRATPSGNTTDPLSYIGYSKEDLSLYFSNYLNNGDSTLINIMLDLDYVTYYYIHNSSDNSYYLHFFHSDYDIGYCFENDSAKYFIYSPIVQRDMYSFRMLDGEFNFSYIPAVRLTTNEYSMLPFYPDDTNYITYARSENPIKILNSTSTNKYKWDGTSYYEEPDEPVAPSLPSNAEIAQAVQAFYNSDYYKNNTDFSDFFALYNYENSTFSFIGHNFGIDLGQVIVPPDYEYEGYNYNQDWWKFFLRNISSELASNLWNRYYWLFSTTDFGENVKSDGKGSIKDLINLHFSTNSIIVYSTTDYPVVKIETDENGVLTPVEGTIPGDQYTYDENLDPTTNEYNPLENFVPTNPSQTILGDVDFNEINKTFEENKDILNIEGASWLFSANNQLTNYFIGFLSLLIVFLIISRILGG